MRSDFERKSRSIDPAWTVLFVQDATTGIFVFTRSLTHPLPRCRPGDWVEIAGVTGPGEFAPTIVAYQTARDRIGIATPCASRVVAPTAVGRRGQPVRRDVRCGPNHGAGRQGPSGVRAHECARANSRIRPLDRRADTAGRARRRRGGASQGRRGCALQRQATDHRRPAVHPDDQRDHRGVAGARRSRSSCHSRRSADCSISPAWIAPAGWCESAGSRWSRESTRCICATPNGASRCTPRRSRP